MSFDIYGDAKANAILEGICNQPIIDKPFNETDNPKPMCEGIKMFNGEVFDTNKWCSGGKSLVLSKNSKVGKAKTTPTKDVKPTVDSKSVELKKDTAVNGTKVVTTAVPADKPVVEAVPGAKVECVSTTPAANPAFTRKAGEATTEMETGAKANKKFAAGSLSDPKRWDILGTFVKEKLGADGKNRDNVAKVLAHIEKMKAKYAR